jgi:hypothetical protein
LTGTAKDSPLVANASGSRDLPAVRVALAATLGVLLLSPPQQPGHAALILPRLPGDFAPGDTTRVNN